MHYLKDIIGQNEAKHRLISETDQGHTPHARMFCGPPGVGKLPLAIAYARYLCCEKPVNGDACGKCPQCKMMDRWAHPDIDFVFPVTRQKSKDTLSGDLMPLWREMMDENPYAAPENWIQRTGNGNGQLQIYVKQAEAMLKKAALKSSQGGWKVTVIWMADKMNAECANKLLKLLEEPPEKTMFLLVTEEPEALPSTLRSRTQSFVLPGISSQEIADELTRRFGTDPQTAAHIARCSQGSWTRATEALRLDDDRKIFLEFFANMMRNAYARRVTEMKQWSETMAAQGRETQKRFLNYAGKMLRENFIANFGNKDIVHMERAESDFAKNFSPYVNEANIIGMVHELEEAENHIARNVNARMVFFDLALKTTVWMGKK